MTTGAVQFKINVPDVVSETIDGEAVIVSLSRGVYYSLDRVGVEAWDLINRGYSLARIVTAIQQTFDGDAELIAQTIQGLLAQLQAEQLITAIASSQADAAPASEAAPAPKEPFVPPVLQKYSDMVDLLMLDPIHDVDETEGWPAKREETAA